MTQHNEFYACGTRIGGGVEYVKLTLGGLTETGDLTFEGSDGRKYTFTQDEWSAHSNSEFVVPADEVDPNNTAFDLLEQVSEYEQNVEDPTGSLRSAVENLFIAGTSDIE